MAEAHFSLLAPAIAAVVADTARKKDQVSELPIPVRSAHLTAATTLGNACLDNVFDQPSDSSQGGSYYVQSRSMQPEHYGLLMDRGWRRSGNLFYLPDAVRSCCPHYTIRLPTAELQPNRDQRQTVHKWNRFVLGDTYIKAIAMRYPKTKEQKKQSNNVFDLSTTIHASEESKLKPESQPDIQPDHRFTVTLEANHYTEEKYRLFEHYQHAVHHEPLNEISRSGFKSFLCSSPIQRKTEDSGKQLGSFHHCYRLDGRLIAMGVLDLLPHAVSGVYFIYHNDFEKWHLGKLSALQEAALAGEAGYQYYYMGYYIHQCEKMRYKGAYKQQYVLDLESHTWDRLDEEVKSLMDHQKYVSMSQERRMRDVNEVVDSDAAVQSEYTSPSEASDSGQSLLSMHMPGVMSLEEVMSEVDLDDMRISIGKGRLHRVTDLVAWHEGSESDTSSIKGIIAELVGCIGPTVARDIIVSFH